MNPYPCLGVKPDGFCPQTPTYSARECTSGAAFWGSEYIGKPWPLGWGNAMYWPVRARAAGFVVDTNCTPNSIMCLPPNHNGAGPMGHVAYVTGPAVQSHAEVWEMDFLIRFGFDYRPALVTGCEYIHLVGKPLPVPIKEDPVVIILEIPGEGNFYRVGSLLCPLASPADQTALIAACHAVGVPVVIWTGVTAAQYANERKACTQPF